MRTFLFLIALLPTLAVADSFQLHLASDHSTPGRYNERNLGIGYTHKLAPNWHVNVTMLDNSQDDTALFGCGFYGPAYFGVGGCAATGYRGKWYELDKPMFAPMVTIRPLPTEVSPRVNIIPVGRGEYVAEIALDFRLD